jgi:hypothetical protein
MKTMIGKWVERLGIPLCISIGYGLLASLLYFVAGFTGGDGRSGAWLLLYFFCWPATWALIEVTARIEEWVPDWLFEFCYTYGVIVAGMIWVYVIAWSIRYVVLRPKLR